MQTIHKEHPKYTTREDRTFYIYNNDYDSDELISELGELEDALDEALDEYEDFDGVSFQLHYNSIDVTMFNKNIEGYCFQSIRIGYDELKNIHDVVNESVDVWDRYDNDETIAEFKKFIADGERYGWD